MPAKRITLALQGGGSHGAFTWGVLDRLLEEDGIEIAGMSGASAGAVNAVLLAHGHAVGGRDGARRADSWLVQNRELVGQRSTFELAKVLG